MPELPEVEVTRRRIGPLLVGRRIREVRTTRDSPLFLTRPARLRARLRGRRFAALARRGKYLVAEFDDGARLVLHLGMTGQLFSSAATSPRLLSATRRAGRVTRSECERLAAAIREVLERSIETGGSSIRDYVSPDGSDGRYQDERRVYARTGEPCLRCGSRIRRTTVAQRGTHFCPTCQR